MSAPSGRTNWLAKDTGWWRRSRIVALGLEFGSVGPAVIDWLTCEAKAQNDGGWVKTGHRAIAHGAFTGDVPIGPLLSRSVQLGLLDEMEGDSEVFTCRISGWYEDQERPLAAVKKAAQRSKETPETPAVTGVPGKGQNGTERDMSPAVPIRPGMSPTGQDRTEEQHPQTPKGDFPVPLVAPVKPSGNRKRDLAEWQAEHDAWSAEHFPGIDPHGVAALVSWVQSRNVPATPDAVREFAANAPNFAHLLEPAAA